MISQGSQSVTCGVSAAVEGVKSAGVLNPLPELPLGDAGVDGLAEV